MARHVVASVQEQYSAPVESGPQSRMVVDLAIVDDPAALVLVRHRLVTACDIDDREPTVCKPDRPLDPEPFVVRSAVTEHVAHLFEP